MRFLLVLVILTGCDVGSRQFVRKADKIVVSCRVTTEACGMTLDQCNDGSTYKCMHNVHIMGELR